jgi:hypothetical protein
MCAVCTVVVLELVVLYTWTFAVPCAQDELLVAHSASACGSAVISCRGFYSLSCTLLCTMFNITCSAFRSDPGLSILQKIDPLEARIGDADDVAAE